MAAKTSAVRIGAFVLGGVAIAVVVATLFGSQALFATTATRSIVFDESLQGLPVGASVTFNGVSVGEVRRIAGVLDTDTGEIRTGVIVELRSDAIVAEETEMSVDAVIERLVERGLKAQLATQSFVTGQLYVRLVDPRSIDPYERPETFMGEPTLPAVPSDMARIGRFAESLSDVLPRLLQQVSTAMEGLSSMFNESNRANFARAVEGAADFTESLGALAPRLEVVVDDAAGVAETLAQAGRDFEELANRLAALADETGPAVADLIADADAATESLSAAASQTSALISENREELSRFTSQGLPELRTLAVELTSMARQIEALTKRIQDEGAGFLLGGAPVREYTPQTAQ